MTNIVSLYQQLFGKKGPESGNVIDMAEHGRAGGINTGQGFKLTRDVEEKTAIDEASSTVTYLGKAKHGAATSDSAWQIKRITVSGTVTTIEYADSDDNYDNVWDDRASLTYG